MMNEKKIGELVRETVLLVQAISEMQERLEQNKAALVTEAQARKSEGRKTEGGGLAVAFNGEDSMARVVFPGPKLVSFRKTDAAYEKISAAAGTFFKMLFRPTTSYKPVKDFREEARLLLREGKQAETLIELCEEKSAPTVSFEVVEKFVDDWPGAE